MKSLVLTTRPHRVATIKSGSTLIQKEIIEQITDIQAVYSLSKAAGFLACCLPLYVYSYKILIIIRKDLYKIYE